MDGSSGGSPTKRPATIRMRPTMTCGGVASNVVTNTRAIIAGFFFGAGGFFFGATPWLSSFLSA